MLRLATAKWFWICTIPKHAV